MKTLAIIGASYLQRPLVDKAKEMGLYTMCFAWEEGAVCKDLVDEFYPISVLEKERILTICKEKQINGICTIASDVAAPTVAYVANKLGLVGNDYEVAVRANNKFAMREAFNQADVDCPKFMKVATLSDDVYRDVFNVMFRLPLIVKPTDRSGSMGVVHIDKWEDLPTALDDAINASFAHEAIVEEFIEGREISVEFISYKGIHYPLQITDKVTTGAPHFVELEHHQPANLSKEMYDQIYTITSKALTALGVTNGASHSEYKITKSGRVVIIEIGARMGGDFIGSDLVRLSTGYDFVKGVIDAALGQFEIPKISKCTQASVKFLCEETKQLLPIIKEAVSHPNRDSSIFQAELLDTKLKFATCSADRSGYVIYRTIE